MSADVMPGGKRIRLRAPTVVVGAAVVAVALAGDLALPRQQWQPAVTNVLAAASAQNLVASGKVGNASWQIIVMPYAHRPGELCWFGRGPAFTDPTTGYDDISVSCSGLLSPGAAFFIPVPPGVRPDPVEFDAVGQPQLESAIGVVRANVTAVVLRLDDGKQLKLTPVKRYGYRLVAFVIPPRVEITSATATLNNGQYATAINVKPRGLPFFWPWRWHSLRGH